MHPAPWNQGFLPGQTGFTKSKQDGYRLIVKRVRLFSHNGRDWSARYPLVVEAALCNRQTSFVIDGEAILLGVDGISDLTACTPESRTTRCSFTRSISRRLRARICESGRCTCKNNLARLLARRISWR
jgi:bifunctional non-homologous end joining protein LigD